MKNYNEIHEAMKQEALSDIKEHLMDGYNGYLCDLHNEVFNTDYYIIGTWAAKEKLAEYGVFDAIGLIQEYEKDNFGEVYTDLTNPEKIANMLYYIIGDEVLNEELSVSDFDDWSELITEETRSALLAKIEELLN